jgi:hypothetical protein
MPVQSHAVEASFEVEITECEECVYQTTSPGAFVYYTNGSRKNGLVGMGIYGSEPFSDTITLNANRY